MEQEKCYLVRFQLPKAYLQTFVLSYVPKYPSYSPPSISMTCGAQKASLPNAAASVASTSSGAGQRDQLEKAATVSLAKGPSWPVALVQRDGRAHLQRRQLPASYLRCTATSASGSWCRILIQCTWTWRIHAMFVKPNMQALCVCACAGQKLAGRSWRAPVTCSGGLARATVSVGVLTRVAHCLGARDRELGHR